MDGPRIGISRAKKPTTLWNGDPNELLVLLLLVAASFFASVLSAVAGFGGAVIPLALRFTVAVGVFRRGGSQELAPAAERDRGGGP